MTPGRSPQGRPRAVLTALSVRDRTERQVRRGVYLLPSLFTLANMFCGYACVIYAMRAQSATDPDTRAAAFAAAAVLIGVAIVLDMLDGRIARLTGTSSAFGVEFDSLADVISFGLAPAILAFTWGLEPLGRLGWASAFIYVTGAAMRLARFNIQAGSTDKRYFVGMPSPAAAALIAATVFFYPVGLTGYTNLVRVGVLALVLVPGLLMVSTVRFRSFKSFDLGLRRSYRNLLLAAVVLVAVAVHPQVVLLLMAYTYLASGLIAFAWGRLKHRRGESHIADGVARKPEAGETPGSAGSSGH